MQTLLKSISKTMKYFCLAFIVTIVHLTHANPYNSGGAKYGESNDLEYADYDNSKIGSGQKYTSNTYDYLSPYNQSSNQPSNQVYSSSQYTTSQYSNNTPKTVNQNTHLNLSGEANNSSLAINNEPNQKPWNKMENWIQDKKRIKTTNNPERNMANQRIEAGKMRIRAIKSKEKLEKYIIESEAKIKELRKISEFDQQQAEFLENQLKFQENNRSQSVNNSTNN